MTATREPRSRRDNPRDLRVGRPVVGQQTRVRRSGKPMLLPTALRHAPTRPSWRRWKTCWKPIRSRAIPSGPWFVSMKRPNNWSGDARANPRQAGTIGPPRVRLRAQRRRQPVHDIRAARGHPARRGHRHTAVDYAHILKDVSDTLFTDRVGIILARDKLNTRTRASLYSAFPPEEALRLANRFEWRVSLVPRPLCRKPWRPRLNGSANHREQSTLRSRS